jgi:hypothetical protein
MKDWVSELDNFAKNYGNGILQNAGTVSHNAALEKANQEYKKYRKREAEELSQAERDYVESVKQMQKKVENKTGKT